MRTDDYEFRKFWTVTTNRPILRTVWTRPTTTKKLTIFSSTRFS